MLTEIDSQSTSSTTPEPEERRPALPQSKRNNRVLETVGPNEPIFVLRAQDVLAPATIRHWAHTAARRGVSATKVSDALAIADVMAAWPNRKLPD